MLSATKGHSQDLQAVLSTVYQTNPEIAAERFSLRAAGEGPVQARAGTAPRLSADLSLSQTDGSQLTTAGLFDPDDAEDRDVDLNGNSVAVNLEKTLFAGYRNRHARGRATAELLAARARFRNVVQDTLLEAVVAYFDVLREQQVYDASQAAVAALDEERDNTALLVEFQVATPTDLLQAESSLASARARLVDAQARLASSRARYRAVVGEFPVTLQPVSMLPALPESLEMALSYARNSAPGIVIAKQAQVSSLRQIGIARAEALPEVSINASYVRSEEPSIFLLEDENFSYGLRARIPIFNGGLVASRVREAKLLHGRARMRVAAAERRIEARTISAWQQHLSARALVVAAEAAETASRSALVGVREEARVGERTTAEILDAEQEYLRTRVEIASARREEMVSAFALLASVGALTVDPGFQIKKPLEVAVEVNLDEELSLEEIDFGLEDETAAGN